MLKKIWINLFCKKKNNNLFIFSIIEMSYSRNNGLWCKMAVETNRQRILNFLFHIL